MDGVKFVPPGGHRACLNCSAAKAKCVFPDDGEVADASLGMGASMFVNATTGTPDMFESGSVYGAGPPSPASPAATGAAARVHGAPAIPRCERCERLNRECFLPNRPRKKRRVGVFKPGTSRAAMESGESASAANSPTGPPSRHTSPPKALQPPSSSSFGGGSSAGSRVASGYGQSPSSHQQHYHQQPLPVPPLATAPVPPRPQAEPSIPQNTLLSPFPPNPGMATAPGSTTLPFAASSPRSPAQQVRAAPYQQRPPHAQPQPPPPQPPLPQATPPSSSAAPLGVPPNSPQALISSILRMRPREADELLRFYRDAYSRFNPYMTCPPPGVKATELQNHKPFIWLTIVFATSYHDFERQIRLAKAIIAHFTELVFQHSHKSLELLQGILLFLNWFIAQNIVVPQYTNLLHVAMALVNDLGLNKLEFSRTASQSPLDRYLAKTVHGPSLNAPEYGHTLDERRALAGAYCLSQAMADSITVMTPLQFTLQLEDSCRIFESNYARRQQEGLQGEASADLASGFSSMPTMSATADYFLAITVRFYHLISRVLTTQREADLCGGHFVIPVATHVEKFVAELKVLWEGLPADARSDIAVRLLYHTTSIYIYELGLSSSIALSRSDPAGSISSKDSDESAPQVSGRELAIRCYIAVKAFFDVYLSLPVGLYHQFPVTMFCQIVHADLTLAKLTALFRGNTRPPGLPADIVLPKFSDIIEAVASRFQHVRNIQHPLNYPVRNISFEAFAARLRSFKVLDLSGRRKGKAAAAAAAAASAAAAGGAAGGAAGSAAGESGAAAQGNAASKPPGAASAESTPQKPSSTSQMPRPAPSRSPPTSNTVLSIDRLIGSVPEATSTDADQASSSSGGAAGGGSGRGVGGHSGTGGGGAGGTGQGEDSVYGAMDIDMEGDGDEARDMEVNPATAVIDLPEVMADVADDEPDPDEQAEWWAWFGGLQDSLLGGGPASTTAAGSVDGASVSSRAAVGAGLGGGAGGAGAGGMAAPGGATSTGGGYGDDGSFFNPERPMRAPRPRGAASVTSIDSLLNNNDQEPNYDTYMQQQYHPQ